MTDVLYLYIFMLAAFTGDDIAFSPTMKSTATSR